MRHYLGRSYLILFKNVFIGVRWFTYEMIWDGKPCMNNCFHSTIENIIVGIVEMS